MSEKYFVSYIVNCVLAFVAFLLLTIPYVALGVAMSMTDSIIIVGVVVLSVAAIEGMIAYFVILYAGKKKYFKF